MKDPEYLRREYNERFKGSAVNWTSENLAYCRILARRIIRWTGLKGRKNLRMLDVGCALGFYTKAFQLEGFDTTGLDYSEVAISRATELHPECRFIHADGFNPDLDQKFDLIFCRNFSGANTHDLGFVAGWSNKYVNLLNPGGKFVFSYSTDFSGKESGDETVNWTKAEMIDYINRVNAWCGGTKYYHRYLIISFLWSEISVFVIRKKVKHYFYIIFTGS